MKKLTTLSLATLLFSTSAIAGGGHEGVSTTSGYNEPVTETNYSDNMTIMGNTTFLYLGAELGWTKANTKTAFTGNDDFWTAAPIVGLRIGENFGVETSYTWGTNDDSVDIKAAAIDAMGYLPINDSKTVSLVGLVGVGRYELDTNIPGDDSDTAVRYGGGIQYEINQNWSTRLLYRRAEVKTSAFDSLDTVTMALTYNFR